MVLSVCGECGVRFRLTLLLRRHLARYRIDRDNDIQVSAYDYDSHAHGSEFVSCPRCNRVYSSSHRLRAHALTCRK
jgi:hypothetical protein